MTEEVVPAAAARRDEPAHLVVEQIWRFFCSPRVTLTTLALLLPGVAAGVYLRQSDSFPDLEKALAGQPTLLAAYRGLELFDPLRSWWFAAALLVLALSLIARSLEGLPRAWLAVKNPERRLDHAAPVVRAEGKGAALEPLAEKLAARGYRVDRIDNGLFAERGRLAPLGLWIAHLGLLLLAIGGLVHAFAAFEGTQNVPQNGGQMTSFLERRPDGSQVNHRLLADDGTPFVIRCDDVRLKEPAQPKSVESDLAVIDDGPGRVLEKATISEGHPLHFGGLTFHQAGYALMDEGARARVVLTEQATGKKQEVLATAGEPIPAADKLEYQLVEYNADFVNLGPAIKVLRKEDGKTTSFWVFQKDAGFDARNRPDRFNLSFDGIKAQYATGLRIERDPSPPLLYAGAFVLLAGLAVSFSTSHKRIWAQAKGGRIALGGASDRRAPVFGREFDDLCAEAGLAGAPRKRERPS